MTKPEKYQELIAEGKTPINCAPDHGHPSKLLCSVDEHGNILLYCSHCHKDRVLKFAQIQAIRNAPAAQQADPIKQLIREMSAWMSVALPSYDAGNANYSMDIEDEREKLQARVKIVLSGGVA